MKPIIAIHNAETNEIETREMTDKEFAAYEKELAESQARLQPIIAEAEARQAARQSALEKLAALGLTEAEIQALAG
jgi:glutamate synthase domain-containing protein 1